MPTNKLAEPAGNNKHQPTIQKDTAHVPDAKPTIGINEAIKARGIADLIAAGDLARLEREIKASGQTLSSFATPFGSILHSAAAVGNVSMFKQILHASGVSVNKRNFEGSTPLHVAARAGKYEMVEFLMGCSDIDDTVRNVEDKTCVDVARNRQIVNIIEYSRAVHVHKVARQMHQAAKRADLPALKRLFPKDQSNLRNFHLVDVNEPDSNGDTILHTAARSDSPQLVQACLNLGADPFAKNRKGKIPLELVRKEGIRKILKEAPMIRSKKIPSGKDEKVDGYLQKWTNYAGGFRRRWFVLEHGILSYYERALDYPVTCRGSLNLEFVRVVPHKTDACKFDLIGAKDAALRFHLKADAQEDAKRWIIGIIQAQTSLNADRARSRTASLNGFIKLGMSHGSGSPIEEPAATQPLLDVVFNELLEQEKQTSILFDMLLEVGENGNIPMSLGAIVESQAAFNARTRVIRDALLKVENTLSGQAYRMDCLEADKTALQDSVKSLAGELNRWHQWSQQKASGKDTLSIDIDVDADTDEMFFDAVEDECEYDDGYASVAEPEPTSQFKYERTPQLEYERTPQLEYERTPQLEYERTPQVEYASVAQIEQDPAEIEGPFSGYPLTHRTMIPADSSKMPAISLWGIVKNAIRQDLTRMPIPINFSEPLSMLQRMCEDFEYWPLLQKCASQELAQDPGRRLCLVTAFAASSYASSYGRVSKPFNPLLGETFEFASRDGGFRYLAEQVSHHPPVGAAHCEADSFEYGTEVRVTSRFRGRYLELQPEGHSWLFFKDVQEQYRWNRVKTAVHNIIVGRLYLEHFGDMVVESKPNGARATLRFLSTGWRQRPDAFARLEGEVVDAQGTVQWCLSGAWNRELRAQRPDGSDSWLVWERSSASDSNDQCYHFSPFSMALNELGPGMAKALCPTDSRLRPDQRAMEDGCFDAASELKVRLEEKQRSTRRIMEAQPNFVYRPRWFEAIENRNEDCENDAPRNWRYKGGYWDARARSAWSDVPDIYL